MQQRYYDPAVGRFLSVDPMASDTQNGWNFNHYNYTANNPYRYTDPDGRCPVDAKKTECVQSTVRVNKQDVTLSSEQEASANSHAIGVRVNSHNSSEEKVTAVKVSAEGKTKMTPLRNLQRSRRIAGETARGQVRKDTDYIAHGHVRDSQVDQPGLGDSSVPLNNEKPNVTISGDRSQRRGVREIKGGFLQHRMLRGSMSEGEAETIQQRMDDAARAYNDANGG